MSLREVRREMVRIESKERERGTRMASPDCNRVAETMTFTESLGLWIPRTENWATGIQTCVVK